MQPAYRPLLARVVLLEGSAERLAVFLGVPSGLVTRWVEGSVPVPPNVFLRCCNYLAAHNEPVPAANESQKSGPLKHLDVLVASPPFAYPTVEKALGSYVNLFPVSSLDAAKYALNTMPSIAMVVCGVYFDELRMSDLLRYCGQTRPLLPLSASVF